jgi:ATP-dependent DNA helicase RecQ
VWGFVEGSRCRREAILRHFGDRAVPAPVVACCDVCDASVRPALPPPVRRRAGGLRAAQLAHRPAASGSTLTLDDAILDVAAAARPPVTRTRAVEILRGGRSQLISRHAYDGLPHYGTYSHLDTADVLARVDALLDSGALRSTGGRFPKLEVA